MWTVNGHVHKKMVIHTHIHRYICITTMLRWACSYERRDYSCVPVETPTNKSQLWRNERKKGMRSAGARQITNFQTKLYPKMGCWSLKWNKANKPKVDFEAKLYMESQENLKTNPWSSILWDKVRKLLHQHFWRHGGERGEKMLMAHTPPHPKKRKEKA